MLSMCMQVGYPPLNKPVKVELGSVSPIIVVPGRWSQADLEHQVEVVAAALSYNSGHCSAGAEVSTSKLQMDLCKDNNIYLCKRQI